MAQGKPPSARALENREAARESIKIKSLIGVLQGDAFGDSPITDGQRASIKILLAKCLPDLASTAHTGDGGGAIKFELSFRSRV